MRKSSFKEKKEEFKLVASTTSNKDLAKQFDISIHTVVKWCGRLNIKKDKNVYRYHRKISIEDEQFLRDNYPTGNMEEICEHLNKKRHAVTELARKYKIKREIDSRRCGTLEPLFDQSLQSFYWLGFIAADGYVSTKGHFMISQSKKDKQNIDNLSIYLNSNIYEYVPSSAFNKNKVYRINISDKLLGVKLRNMFGIKENETKTKSGINLNFIKNQKQALAFLVGIIEGDGSLTKNLHYKLECHANWHETFRELVKKLPKKHCNVSLYLSRRKDKNVEYCILNIKKSFSVFLRKFIKETNLTCSDRKFWDQIH